MTVVNPKSISGINSITTGSGSDNLLTIHTNDGTERVRVDSTGATKIVTGIVTTLTATGSAKVGSGVTLSPDGDVFVTGISTVKGIHVNGTQLGEDLKVGTGVTITRDGDVFATGVTTSTTVKVGGGVTISESGIEASGIGITCANINGTQIGGRKNIVINGAMNVAQRGTSFTSTGAEYTVDRFKHEVGSSFNFDTTTTQSTDHPNGFKNSLAITPDSVVTPSGSENGAIRMQLEGQDLQQFAHGTSGAKPMTVSFYAKSATVNSGHVYSIQIRKYDPSDNRKYVLKPFTVTDSWQRFSFTFIGDTAQSISDGITNGMELAWQLSSGPDDLVSETSTWTSSTKFQAISGQNNFMDNTSNQFFLTGVQLEVGSQATDFEHRSFGEELALCQRYFYMAASGADDSTATVAMCLNYTSASARAVFHFPVTMRTIPDIYGVEGTNYFRILQAGGAIDGPDEIHGGNERPNMAEMAFEDDVVGLNQGEASLLRLNNAAARIGFIAEL